MQDTLLIVGGGALGSAVAACLAERPDWRGRITVLERDPTYERASSARSAASIRQQFSTPLNIALSLHGLEVLRAAGPQAALVEQGYLYLIPPTGVAQQEALHAVQRAQGADVALLSPAELQRRFPWLATQDLALGSWGRSGEGWFDGWGLLQSLKQRAQAAGVRYVKDEAIRFETDGTGQITGVCTAGGDRLRADRLVLAGGAWSAPLAATAGIALPVSARRRSVYAFRTPEPAAGCPLVIDPSGLWFRPEGPGQFLCGGPPLGDDAPDLPLDPEADLFEERLWLALAERVPGFATLRQERSWAGYYEMNDIDHNGLVGPWPGQERLLMACGFSGHGLQHAPGIGRGLAEWIAAGRYETLDLSPLGADRLQRGEPYRELNVI